MRGLWRLTLPGTLAVICLSLVLIKFDSLWSNAVTQAQQTESVKTRSTIYTPDKVNAARVNIKKYDWARKLRNQTTAVADKYVALGLDRLWSAITPQSVPRSYAVNQELGSPVTGKKIDEYGQFPYEMDAWTEPWKLTDPSSGYKFPTNDYAAYYKSGLDDAGVFDPKRADRSLLVNTLYPEKGKTWGVDDGYGWVDGNGNRYTFVAYYNHIELWEDFIFKALINLRDAYLYTGEAKYADAGIVMLDRIADLYPAMDTSVYAWADGYRNSSTTGDRGKILGSIAESEFIRDIISCYDAFWPALANDSAASVRFLAKKAGVYKLGSSKSTADLVKANIETGLIRQIYPAVTKAQITGNFGMPQSALAMAAVVLDEPGTTEQWLRFVAQTGGLVTSKDTAQVTGGNLLSTLVDQVDSDGYGNEASPHYNETWLLNTKLIADILAGYDRNPIGDLYDNVKFKKMLYSYIDLVMVGKYTPQIGDSGSVGNPGLLLEPDVLRDAYAKYDDPKLAQALYYISGDSFADLHGGIFDDDAGELANKLKAVVDEFGPLQLDSDNLTGYGLAIMREGRTDSSFADDRQRDVWLYYGRNGISHPHKDSLNIGVHAFGLDLAPDMGYVSYADDNALRAQWESNTVSHNTVVVDRAMQKGQQWVGLPAHFDRTDRVQWVDVESPKVYPQTELYRRTTAMIKVDDANSYAVDFFRVQGGQDHTFSFHGAGASVATDGLRLAKQDGGTYAGSGVSYADAGYNASSSSGFNYLTRVERDNAPPPAFSVDWQIADTRKLLPEPADIHLRLTMLGQFDDVALADGEPPQNKVGNPKTMRYALAHRKGSNLSSTFTSVIEPYKANRYIQSIALADVSQNGKPVAGDEVKAVKVTLEGGRVDYVISALRSDQLYTIDNKIRFQGSMGVYSERDGKPEYAYVGNGVLLAAGAATLVERKSGDISGTVTGFTRELSDRNAISVRLNGLTGDPAALVGKYVYIDNDYRSVRVYNKARNAVYRIKGIRERNGDAVTLDIGDITLVRGWNNANNFDMGYEYNIREGAMARIPLSADYISPDAPPGAIGKLPFKDVPAGFWGANAIAYLYERRIVQGVNADTFDPLRTVTRAEFTALLARALGLPAAGHASGFQDVAAGSWYEGAIAAAVDAGIVQGVSSTAFMPAAPVTREQMAALLVRAYQYRTGAQGMAGTPYTFADNGQISEWARPLVASAADLGLIARDDRFRPLASANRAESAQAIYNMLRKIANDA